jgi:ADP-L-glycero-D-manno-heptose 6-epimerase
MSKGPIIVTGGSGFLGSNLIRKINHYGQKNIIIIDNYDDSKFNNIKSLQFVDYITFTKGLDFIRKAVKSYSPSCIMHIGAKADNHSTEPEIMMEANFEHSKFYLELAQDRKIPMVYASSAAVYGDSLQSTVEERSEAPHNTYAWSKWLFDHYVSNNISSFNSRVIGLRIFDIFGIGEFHKGINASLPFRFFNLIKENGFIDLFDREIKRDYVWVEDVADVFIDVLNYDSIKNGIYNLGGGNPVSDEAVANIIADAFVSRGLFTNSSGLVKRVPVPEVLINDPGFHHSAENLLEMISRRAAGNVEKIKNYINQLINISYEGKV